MDRNAFTSPGSVEVNLQSLSFFLTSNRNKHVKSVKKNQYGSNNGKITTEDAYIFK